MLFASTSPPRRQGLPILSIDRSTSAAALKVCACFNMRRASRAVTRLFDEILLRGGLRSTQFVALVAIHAGGGPSLPRLARDLGLDRSTLTRNLRPMVKAGLIEVGAAPPSQTATARLTAEGEAALERCVPLWQEAQARLEAKLGPGTWQNLLGGLDRVLISAPDA